MKPEPEARSTLFDSIEHAALYDRSINWPARLTREIPALRAVFGPPGAGGILDAGCGPGRQACALAQKGYRVVGADQSETVLDIGRSRAADVTPPPEFVRASYAELHDRCGTGFDGVYCIGNSLAASGTRGIACEAVRQFGLCLRSGGRLFVQILNFSPMRTEVPCVKGPRVVTVDGIEYVSTRQFHFADDHVVVTNVTVWHDGTWKQKAHSGRLYPISAEEMRAWCDDAGLRIDELRGGYNGAAFDVATSVDLIVVGTKR